MRLMASFFFDQILNPQNCNIIFAFLRTIVYCKHNNKCCLNEDVLNLSVILRCAYAKPTSSLQQNAQRIKQ